LTCTGRGGSKEGAGIWNSRARGLNKGKEEKGCGGWVLNLLSREKLFLNSGSSNKEGRKGAKKKPLNKKDMKHQYQAKKRQNFYTFELQGYGEKKA